MSYKENYLHWSWWTKRKYCLLISTRITIKERPTLSINNESDYLHISNGKRIRIALDDDDNNGSRQRVKINTYRIKLLQYRETPLKSKVKVA